MGGGGGDFKIYCLAEFLDLACPNSCFFYSFPPNFLDDLFLLARFFPHFLLTFLTPQKILPSCILGPPKYFHCIMVEKYQSTLGKNRNYWGNISSNPPWICSPVSRVKFLPENSYPELLLRILRKCMLRPVMYSGLCHILRSEYRIETIDLRVEIYILLSANRKSCIQVTWHRFMAIEWGSKLHLHSTAQKKLTKGTFT